MRKRLKKKKHSCGLCKPHKLGWMNRWKEKEFVRMKEFEKEKKSVVTLVLHSDTIVSECTNIH